MCTERASREEHSSTTEPETLIIIGKRYVEGTLYQEGNTNNLELPNSVDLYTGGGYQNNEVVETASEVGDKWGAESETTRQWRNRVAILTVMLDIGLIKGQLNTA